MHDQDMQCPRDKSPLNTEIYEAGVEVDTCPTCEGVWLDKGELEQIQKCTERDYSRELEIPQDTVAASIAQGRMTHELVACPKCGTLMHAREYAYCSQVVVDACPDGCGMWLDKGELQELEKFFEAQQQPSVSDHAEYLWASLLSVFHRPRR